MDPVTTLLLAIEGVAQWIIAVMNAYGPAGIFVGMLLESSFVPIPSELILITAGMTGIPLWQIVIAAALGSTAGSFIGYYIGRFGRPVVDRYGKYIFLTDSRINSAEMWVSRHGSMAIFLARLIPFIPYKVFSITAGLLKMDFKKFALFTFLGSIPRALILAVLGEALAGMHLKTIALMLTGCAVAYLVWHFRFRPKDLPAKK